MRQALLEYVTDFIQLSVQVYQNYGNAFTDLY